MPIPQHKQHRNKLTTMNHCSPHIDPVTPCEPPFFSDKALNIFQIPINKLQTFMGKFMISQCDQFVVIGLCSLFKKP